ncbi:MAG: DUF445 family protein [Corynebacterium sp.]|nr:DUF445 family protein [Corynebacterium sp.]
MNFMEMPGDAERRAALRKYRTFSTSLLILAAVILIITLFFDGAWAGYVRAAAEAGMVGGLADWFAVTALFRHPLGLPIPHTALIKNKKDQVGQSLSGFVSQNFLNAETITGKIHDLNAATLIAEGLTNYAPVIDKEARALAVNFIRSVKEDTAQELIQTLVIDNLMDTPWAPPAGRALERLDDKGLTLQFIDQAFDWAAERAPRSDALKAAIGRAINQRVSWLPSFAAQFAEDKVYQEVCNWLSTVADDPHHEVKRTIYRKISNYAQELQTDPEKLEWLKDMVKNTEQYQQAPQKIWHYGQRELVDALERDSSIVSERIIATIYNLADRLTADEAFSAKVNARIERGTSFVVERYGTTLTNIIGETVERWDADQASEKIELMVGKDLQFIRINGTVIGALAGFVIYTVVQIIEHFI